MDFYILIGLPGSGKTTWAQSRPSKYLYFDDFISDLYKGDIQNAIRNKIPMYLSDPRLCNYEIFLRYISPYFPKDQTLLILFENNPEQCIRNCLLRGSPKRIQNDIFYWSSKYNPYNYREWNHQIIPVYQNH